MLLGDFVHCHPSAITTCSLPTPCAVCRVWVQSEATRRVWSLGLLLYCTIWSRQASTKAALPSHRAVNTHSAQSNQNPKRSANVMPSTCQCASILANTRSFAVRFHALLHCFVERPVAFAGIERVLLVNSESVLLVIRTPMQSYEA